jgi:predicted nuclease of predicted toxin-antitoxin system
MADQGIAILLDQNVPVAAADWMRRQRPQWRINHVNELGFAGRSDEFLYRWAQEHRSVIVTYDEHFADARSHSLGQHHGIVRLRVWPTTVEATIDAMSRLLSRIPEDDWRGSLLIVDNQRIRVRKLLT